MDCLVYVKGPQLQKPDLGRISFGAPRSIYIYLSFVVVHKKKLIEKTDIYADVCAISYLWGRRNVLK